MGLAPHHCYRCNSSISTFCLAYFDEIVPAFDDLIDIWPRNYDTDHQTNHEHQ